MYAVVTGGSTGLGYYIAKALSKRKYRLILISRNEERLKKAAKELNAEWYALDLSKNYLKAGEIIKKIKPAVLVNNAGFGLYGEFADTDPQKIIDMINLNVTALTHLTKIAFEVMDKGHILNIASVAACHPQPRLSVYAATKAYVAHLSRSLIKEAPPQIKVSYVLLGPTKTNFFKNAGMSTKAFEKIMLSPEMVAEKIVRSMFRGKKRITPGIIYKLYCLGRC